MAQPIPSKAALAQQIDLLYANKSSALRQEIMKNLSMSNTGLWTDGGEPVEGHPGPRLDPEENVQ